MIYFSGPMLALIGRRTTGYGATWVLEKRQGEQGMEEGVEGVTGDEAEVEVEAEAEIGEEAEEEAELQHVY